MYIVSILAEPESKLPDFVALSLQHSKKSQEFNSDSDDEDEEENDKNKNEKNSINDSDGNDGEIELLSTLHTILMDTHVQEGELLCDGCSRKYLIQQGIPNMRLNENEV